MTGYAALDEGGRRWELRSVNARGLDLRLRLPEAPAGLEAAARAALAKRIARGNVSLSLRVSDQPGTAVQGPTPEGLDRALMAIGMVEARAAAAGLKLAPPRATDILALRSLWFDGESTAPAGPDLETCTADLDRLIDAFEADRAREGAALHDVLGAQVAEIAALTRAATDLAEARAAHIASTFTRATARLAQAAPEAAVDPGRTAQEIAALAVKADITEELDRLATHIAAAEALLAEDAPVGRRLDFLTQEFNREANTLCSKAGMAEMTAIGLELKAVIDRLREQVQNVE